MASKATRPQNRPLFEEIVFKADSNEKFEFVLSDQRDALTVRKTVRSHVMRQFRAQQVLLRHKHQQHHCKPAKRSDQSCPVHIQFDSQPYVETSQIASTALGRKSRALYDYCKNSDFTSNNTGEAKRLPLNIYSKPNSRLTRESRSEV